jgi:hypothetical protein
VRGGAFDVRGGAFEVRGGGFVERAGGFEGFEVRAGGFDGRAGGFVERAGGFDGRAGGFVERAAGLIERRGAGGSSGSSRGSGGGSTRFFFGRGGSSIGASAGSSISSHSALTWRVLWRAPAPWSGGGLGARLGRRGGGRTLAGSVSSHEMSTSIVSRRGGAPERPAGEGPTREALRAGGGLSVEVRLAAIPSAPLYRAEVAPARSI